MNPPPISSILNNTCDKLHSIVCACVCACAYDKSVYVCVHLCVYVLSVSVCLLIHPAQ